MTGPITFGFSRMHKEAGEKRVFLPDFVEYLTQLGVHVYLEEGYGSRSGYTFDDYRRGNTAIHLSTREETFQKDYVLVLRSPTLDEFALLGKSSCLISMLHLPTRPKRVQLLQQMNAKAISLDSIINDYNLRLVEDMKAVAWNGIQVAYDVLEERWPNLIWEDQRPFSTLIIGTGMVGKHAVEAATKFGDIGRNSDHIKASGLGAVAIAIGRNATQNLSLIEHLFRQTDVLVDASQRRDPSRPVIPNAWIAWLPEHALIVDLSVDPYNLEGHTPVVRGIEGIPQGNLDKYIFRPDDPKWAEKIPESIPTQNRRTTVSCYSWPGIHPEASMMHYAHQLESMMGILVEKGYEDISLNGDYFERALYRGSLRHFLLKEVNNPDLGKDRRR